MPADERVRTVLFYRNFKKFHGGHLKVWDYFNHVRASPQHTPRIAFTPQTSWDESNPWAADGALVVEDAGSVHPDIFFLAGRDWEMAEEHPDFSPDVPVINFLQHVRHADPESSRHGFLRRKAIRICVSEVVADAVRETGLTEGPVLATPNSVDLDRLPAPGEREQDIDVLIAGLKRPARARKLEARLEAPGRRIVLLRELLPREEYLNHVQRARVTVFLPNDTEGFYLPPLEGMAMGTLVVCPEHDGEHAIYRHGENCFRPAYELDELAVAAEAALALDTERTRAMRAAARKTAEGRSMQVERATFLEILNNVDELW